MSKKSRKKSPKTSSSRPRSATSSKAPKAATAKKSPSTRRKESAAISHKSASKRLNSSSSTPSPSRATVSSAKAKSLNEGAKAPAFHLPRDGGGMISLSDYAGKKLVLFFYPKADTPGCTREAIDFTRLKGAFADCGTEVLGISADSQAAQEKFRDKHKLGVPLISDAQHQMLEAYGAWGEKSMYGRTFLGILRTTVLIDADGRIARVWTHVKVDGHADAVLAAAQAM